MTLSKPTVTALEVHKEDPAKRDLYVDGAFYITLPLELVLQQDLYVGAPFGEEEVEALTFAAELIPAREKAYQYLGYGDLSRKRLYEKLTRFGIRAEVAEATCDQMEERGYVDDSKLALRLAVRFAEGKYWGPRRILPELLQRGIPMEEAREAVDALEVDFTESVRHHLETKYRNYDLKDRKVRQKVVQGLLRLGFDYEDIRLEDDDD
ncbi:MAG: regulatory protein RecX [Clostridia bacterium]|nr:regulatory protein RecX [Clostridia bacterium]